MASLAEPSVAKADDLFVRAALDEANLNAVRIALLQATGDPELEAMDVIDVPFWAGAYQFKMLDPKHHETVKAKAINFLRTGTRSRCPKPSDTDLRRLISLYIGEEANDYIHHFGSEELNFADFPRGVEWAGAVPPARRADFHIIVIGAGAAGLVAAIQLKRLGIPFTIIERNPEVGGTWWTNNYPDARVDVASHHYQLTVTKNYPWNHRFATQPELLEYMRHVADTYDLRGHIKFRTELTDASWDESAKQWRVTLKGEDGVVRTFNGNAIISAAGLFNSPNLPDIEGIETFGGKIFHTTNWDHGFDYSGKKVGIIGVGCTGAQLMPKVAEDAGELVVFQRSPHWVSKLEGYRDPVSDKTQWLLDNLPHYANWNSFAIFHTLCASDGELHELDRDWRAKGGSISLPNDALRDNVTAYIKSQFPDDQEMVAKLTPKFPPFQRRLIIDNGWFDALKKPHVTLETDGIARVDASGIVTSTGKHHDLDLIVLAGGFKTEQYTWPVKYTGKDGRTLEEAWSTDGARAYLGMTIPDFPNMFIIYGPNIQQRAGGIFSWLEIWVRYAVQAIANMIEVGFDEIEVRRDVFDAYNRRIDERQGKCIWALDDLKSYFVNQHGRQVVNSPLSPSETYLASRKPNMADFELS